ncbi:patatin-like phospholipase family protein [Flavitalea sp.]|nr:patatin-like phospholipase family protein [Flavitalea sp.]
MSLTKFRLDYIVITLLIFLAYSPVNGQDIRVRPKIGVALSGGGAKGLAHIGILKAIDSAGLKVDYITGTSMGSIIGSLYAIGYSADSIEKLARKIDWDILLSNQASLKALIIEEKDEYGKYAIELPWVNHGFRLPSGVLEGEELWLKFSELFFPVYNIKKFSDFSIPFKCIGADIATGETVILDSGEIVTAVRASMAIPSVFTAVEHNGRKLVDGGVVRNFPVRDVREMGADYVIGSNVALGLLPKEKVTNAIQILMQIAFFKESEDNKKEVESTDMYITHPIENYNAGSFSRSEELLEIGLEEGRKMYPALKRLADSLNEIYGVPVIAKNRLPVIDSLKISDIEINGLDKTTKDFFQHMMGFYENKFYTTARVSNMIRRVFGTRYYSRIVYRLESLPDGSVKIIIDVVENPRTFAKVGIHYTQFTGIGLLLNLTSRNFFLPHSRSLVTVNLGETFRARAEHLQYLGRGKNVALILGTQYERFDMNTYQNYKRDGLYKMHLFKGDAKMEHSTSRKYTLGAGTRYEWIHYNPSIQSSFELDGKNEFLTTYGYFGVNTLDRSIYPRRGWKINGEFGLIYNQSPDITFYSEGVPVGNLDSFGISYSNFQQAKLNVEAYLTLSRRSTLFTNFQGGINFGYNQNILNDFIIGGMYSLFRNQITFAGLDEAAVYTPSVAALQIGYRFQLFNNLFIIARSNGLVNNFISKDNVLQRPAFLSGHALSMGYNFALGPLEVSAAYSDQSKQVQSVISLGISF